MQNTPARLPLGKLRGDRRLERRIHREGVRHQVRYVLDKTGVLDIERMRPDLPERPNEDISVMAEIGVDAASAGARRARGDSARRSMR